MSERFGGVPDGYVQRSRTRRPAARRRSAHCSALDRPPTAVVTSTDTLAVGVLHAAYRPARPCPTACPSSGSTTSCSPRHTVPALTTLRMPTTEIVRRASAMAIDLARDPSGPLAAQAAVRAVADRPAVDCAPNAGEVVRPTGAASARANVRSAAGGPDRRAPVSRRGRPRGIQTRIAPTAGCPTRSTAPRPRLGPVPGDGCRRDRPTTPARGPVAAPAPGARSGDRNVLELDARAGRRSRGSRRAGRARSRRQPRTASIRGCGLGDPGRHVEVEHHLVAGAPRPRALTARSPSRSGRHDASGSRRRGRPSTAPDRAQAGTRSESVQGRRGPRGSSAAPDRPTGSRSRPRAGRRPAGIAARISPVAYWWTWTPPSSVVARYCGQLEGPHEVRRAARARVPRRPLAGARIGRDPVRPSLERVDVEEPRPVGGDPGQDAVEDRPLDDVGAVGVAGREEQAPGEHDAGDRRARLGVGLVGRQLVRVAERLVSWRLPSPPVR